MKIALPKKLPHLITTAAFLLILAARLPAVHQPFGRDQGIFACIGQNILKGLVPYRDLWDQKPPGIHFTYALFLWLFGDSMRAIQVMDLLALAITALMIYALAREVSGTRAGIFSLLIYFFYSDPLFYGYGSGYWARSQAETYMVPFLVGGFLVFFRFLRFPTGWRAWIAGLLWGAAFIFKYTALLYPLCALVFLGLRTISARKRLSQPTFRSLGRTLILLGFGFTSALLPFIIYFGLHGALKDFFTISVLYNLKYAGAEASGGVDAAVMLGQWVKWTLRNPFLWLTGLAGGIAVAARARKEPETALWLFWLAAAWGAIVMNGRYFHYYFIQIAPPLALLSACLLDHCINTMKTRISRVPAVIALAVCLLLLGLDIQKVRLNLRPDRQFALGQIAEQEFYGRFATGDFSFLANLYLAAYLREKTAPEDSIYIFGFEPLVYFLAERRPASRYIFNDPVTVPYTKEEKREAGIREILTDMESRRAAYLVIVAGDANAVDPTDSFEFFENTPSFKDYVDTRYALARSAGRFHIYKRNKESRHERP